MHPIIDAAGFKSDVPARRIRRYRWADEAIRSTYSFLLGGAIT
jgi:hypothetical protein